MKKIYSTLLFFICLVFLTSCAELFQDKIPMQNNSNSNLSDFLLNEVEISELESPSQLFASQGKSSTTIDITWSQVAGAVSYRLERAIISQNPDGSYTEPDESLFEVLQEAVYTTSYTDTILLDSSTYSNEYTNRYYYRVSAENNRKKYTASPFTEPFYGSLFSKPQNIFADLGESTEKITIQWDFVENATSYEVYRTTSSSGIGAVRIATVTADRNQYTNSISTAEQGTEFYYLVYAINRYGNKSAASSITLGYTLVTGAPSQPQDVKVSNGRGTTIDSIDISWNQVQSDKTVKYYVYRTSSNDSSYTLLGTTETTSYTDKKSLKPNLYYYYQVQASIIDETGTELKSKFSDSGANSKQKAEGFLLSPPTTIFTEKVKGGADIIKWQPALGSEEEQLKYAYEIYGSSTEDFSTSLLLETVNGTEMNTDTGYILKQLSQNATFYKIKTINTEVAISSHFSTITAPVPFAAENVFATKHEKLDISDFIANNSGVYPVKITWSKPIDDNPFGYHVYRSTKKDSGFRKITSEPTTNLYFIDKDETSKAGKIYYYKVLSVNSLEQGSLYSSTTEGYGALTYEQYMREYNKTIKNSHKKLTLMHKSDDMKKLGSESANGTLSGSLHYNAEIAGLGANITMKYENYADFYIDNDQSKGVYFCVTGNSDTSANMSANGTMSGTVVCSGMYPGKVYYDKIEIKGGGAGGGTYGIEPQGFSRGEVSWVIGEE